MDTQLRWKGINFEYKLFTLNQIDYRIFLDSDKPEEVIFGILGNFGNDTPKIVTETVIKRIRETSKDTLSLSKYLTQLRVLSKIRKLDSLIEIIMDSISKYIDEKTDILYIKGKDAGLYEGKKSFVRYLIEEGEKTFEQISDIAGVPFSFVQEVAKTHKG